MLKIKLRSNQKSEENPYIFKWGVEFLGRTVDLSLSRKEWADLKERGQKFFSQRKTSSTSNVESISDKIKEKREHKEEIHKTHSKKNSSEREAVA